MTVTTSTEYGLQKILWPDFTHEFGASLHSKITSSVEFIADNLIARRSDQATLSLVSDTFSFTHNLDITPVTELKFEVFSVEDDRFLTSAERDATFTFAETNRNETLVTRIAAGLGPNFHFFAVYRKLAGSEAATVEPGVVSSSTSGAVGTSEKYAREDHSHDLNKPDRKILNTGNVSWVTVASNSIGPGFEETFSNFLAANDTFGSGVIFEFASAFSFDTVVFWAQSPTSATGQFVIDVYDNVTIRSDLPTFGAGTQIASVTFDPQADGVLETDFNIIAGAFFDINRYEIPMPSVISVPANDRRCIVVRGGAGSTSSTLAVLSSAQPYNTSFIDGAQTADGGSNWFSSAIIQFEMRLPLASPTFIWDSDFIIEIAGVSYSSNILSTSESPIIFTADNQCAYVTPNTSDPGGPLSVTVVNSPSLVPIDSVIIARRLDGKVITGSTILENNDNKGFHS